MPIASIIVPAFNAAKTLQETLTSLQSQTFIDFEIIVVDDGSTDATPILLKDYAQDPEIRVVTQHHRGLSSARNYGISVARGEYIGFCNADETWLPEKLATHVAHLQDYRDVGVSYSGSAIVDERGALLGISKHPILCNLTLAQVFKLNPVGNGSGPVIRRAVFDAIAYRPATEVTRDWYFDETFQQCEDVECWLRIALTTSWRFEGIAGELTHNRVHANGLSAMIGQQLASWDRMVRKLTPFAPAFFHAHSKSARAYLLRRMARRAILAKDRACALDLLSQSVTQSWKPLWEEPRNTIKMISAAMLLRMARSGVVNQVTRRSNVNR